MSLLFFSCWVCAKEKEELENPISSDDRSWSNRRTRDNQELVVTTKLLFFIFFSFLCFSLRIGECNKRWPWPIYTSTFKAPRICALPSSFSFLHSISYYIYNVYISAWNSSSSSRHHHMISPAEA